MEGQQFLVLSVDNPETENNILSIAPGEGQKPLSIMCDATFELMSNPDKFSFGRGGFNTEKIKSLTYRKYFNQRLLNIDGLESKQILDDAKSFIWRQRPYDSGITAAQARDPRYLKEYVRKDKAHRFMKNVRGSPPYYQRTFHNLLVMVRQLGTPTWFFTVSAADLRWPDLIQVIARRNPIAAARHFRYRLNCLFNDFLTFANPLGILQDYAVRVEFHLCGSPHAHCVLWIKDAPKFGVHPEEKVCKFIDKYMSCKMPTEEGQLLKLVKELQTHRHLTYGKRSKKCHFNFPRMPSSRTLIASQSSSDNNVSEKVKKYLENVRKLLVDGHTDISIDELIELAVKDIKLVDGFGTMVKRGTEAVLSFHKYSKKSDPNNH
uniref:Helitron helicase-like domain-containing protein n=1 Tax=Amphimedon queenslandica TaxID=400682 RepID=A0A1X7UEJ7_AMPQE